MNVSHMGGRVRILKLKLTSRYLFLIQVYGSNSLAQCLELVEETRMKTNESVILLKGFNAHVGNDADAWESVISPYGDANIKIVGFCC